MACLLMIPFSFHYGNGSRDITGDIGTNLINGQTIKAEDNIWQTRLVVVHKGDAINVVWAEDGSCFENQAALDLALIR